MGDAEIEQAQFALAKAVLNRHVRRLREAEGRQRAANFARQIARHAFLEAGIELADGCSVHEEHGTINLTAEW